MRTLLLAGCLGLVLGPACSDADAPSTDDATAAEAAAQLCPVMWTWVKDVGAAFNRAAADVGELDLGPDRRRRWLDALDEIEARNDRLGDQVAAWRDDAVLAPVVAEIERDLPRASEELDDIRLLFEDHPEVDEQRHQSRTSQVIVRIEKVIDLPKPELASIDPDLIPGFRTVPACQHSIKDVDDGTAQANE